MQIRKTEHKWHWVILTGAVNSGQGGHSRIWKWWHVFHVGLSINPTFSCIPVWCQHTSGCYRMIDACTLNRCHVLQLGQLSFASGGLMETALLATITLRLKAYQRRLKPVYCLYQVPTWCGALVNQDWKLYAWNVVGSNTHSVPLWRQWTARWHIYLVLQRSCTVKVWCILICFSGYFRSS